jgi:hypothetical protein
MAESWNSVVRAELQRHPMLDNGWLSHGRVKQGYESHSTRNQEQPAGDDWQQYSENPHVQTWNFML